MSEDQAIPQAPAGRAHNGKPILLRAAAFGGGFAVVAALLLGGGIWLLNRPKQWSDQAITAKPTELLMQQVGDELRIEFRYAFTNHTNAEYELPSSNMGSLMRKLPKDGSFDKMSGATWDGTIKIPPQQSVGVTFLMPYKFSDYNTSAAEVEPDPKLAAFVGRRLKDIDVLVFFDYAAKYKVVMPKNWDALKQESEQNPPPKKATALIPPDRGDVFDKVHACENAEQLFDRCKRDNVSLGSHGAWPTPLRELPTPPAGYTLDPSPDVCAIAAEWRNYCKAKVN